jgi:hypothetical protein
MDKQAVQKEKSLWKQRHMPKRKKWKHQRKRKELPLKRSSSFHFCVLKVFWTCVVIPGRSSQYIQLAPMMIKRINRTTKSANPEL